MGVINGRDGQVWLGDNVTAELKEWSITDEMDIAKSTSKGSDYAHKFPGIKDWKASCKFLFDPTDTNGQMALRTAYSNSTKITDIKFFVNAATGYYAPDLAANADAGCYIKSVKVNSPESGAVTYDVEIEGDKDLGFFPGA